MMGGGGVQEQWVSLQLGGRSELRELKGVGLLPFTVSVYTTSLIHECHSDQCGLLHGPL